MIIIKPRSQKIWIQRLMVVQQDLLAEVVEKLPHSEKKRQIFSKINKEYFQNKNQKFLTHLIQDAIQAKDFKYAQKACLHMKYKQDVVGQLFENYTKQVKENESDLVVARYILLLIVTNKTADSYQCFVHFQEYLKDSLYKSFFNHLFKAFQLKSKEIFLKLKETFQNTLQRDPAFEKYMNMIGQGYFQIQSNQPFDLMSIMSGMFS